MPQQVKPFDPDIYQFASIRTMRSRKSSSPRITGHWSTAPGRAKPPLPKPKTGETVRHFMKPPD